ncbi:hypothetical protein C7999DRAFT_17753 [Corynascus novoguineensis]|uniref:Sulfate transporter n=1 Tax=Corynascus novoguineensis TaxID=1126955 RepID=A0AAN7CMV0_9PEZI|nr:hypothetical protein C7999DRAFT_17753 [Corynascus novoguineensis]
MRQRCSTRFFSELARRNRHNIRTLRQAPIAEISGALGDLGTLLPLMIALALQGSIDLPSTLVFTGLFNIVTGIVFGIPLPVQPMKAIAASALATNLSLHTTTAAGALVSLAVLLLSATGAIGLLTARTPVPIVKGIQLGAALRLVGSGAALILPLAWLPQPPGALFALDSRLAAIIAFLVLFLTQRAPRFPYALLLFLLGLLTAFFVSSPSLTLSTTNHRWSPFFHLRLPAFTSPAAWTTALSQLPLTTLNSVVAVSALATDLAASWEMTAAASAASPPSATALGFSVAAMNLAGCWFGAMPVCHGAGGLAAQVRFGARSGASVVLLGIAKLALGLFASLPSSSSSSSSSTVVDVLWRFPKGVLGVMVVAAGLELGKVGVGFDDRVWEGSEGVDREGSGVVVRRRGKEREERWMVMMVTAAGTLAFKNDAVGFLAGCCCHGAYKVSDWAERRGVLRGEGERRPLLR